MAFFQANDFHEGEKMMHEKLRVPERDNPTMPLLSPQAANMLIRAPLLAVGTLDAEGRPWTTLWGGEKGFSRPLGNSIVGIRTPVAATSDPVVEALVGHKADGEVVQETGKGRMVSGLSIDLETRKRVKLAGRMMAGALDSNQEPDTENTAEAPSSRQGLLQLVLKIDESLGNCPKYLNKKEIVPSLTAPRLISDSVPLQDNAVHLIQKSDLFFMSTKHSEFEMDTNHRGGPPGFVRVIPSDDGPTQFVYPEYSGNRLYQSLGNMLLDPEAGFCFPDFDTGDCLYVTGTTQILFGQDAANVMPRSNLAVKVTITAARYVSAVLPFRGHGGEASPYNPVVRFLASEHVTAQPDDTTTNRAKLLEQIPLTPNISRFRFSLTNAATYKAGQYVTLDCSEHLDFGYSHMRDDDPRSLNDDFIRTFTVSSPPGLPPQPTKRLADDEFEITIRKVGVVTDFLFKHGLKGSRRAQDLDLEIGVKGFGGTFTVSQDNLDQPIGFVAAGVGITPLMPCLSSLDMKSLRLLWTVRMADVGLVASLLEEHPKLAQSLTLFVTGTASGEGQEKLSLEKLQNSDSVIHYRRMKEEDLSGYKQDTARWYVCTGTKQRDVVLKWLEGREVTYEDYNF
ncbi:oxidoreductase FAD/NAD(P)-binding protein [Myriangium duriaei CBS 260.36]|uniref:Oxidoreductase FAD/NAD(P)-binding protein n=1 Tax=Myriangium duriaei CBS 260.36 TaxID=1168546 RepID=A0A9P4J484_9PEZI|nr:oxidoreductase FAD/NAD(P)-binding protein [Myriangium duriaei CBS 260.36]